MTDVARTRLSGVAMTLHWITALLMIFMIISGEDLMEAEGPEEAAFLPSIHVSIGAAILLLTLLRILWRMFNPALAYPATMKRW